MSSPVFSFENLDLVDADQQDRKNKKHQRRASSGSHHRGFSGGSDNAPLLNQHAYEVPIDATGLPARGAYAMNQVYAAGQQQAYYGGAPPYYGGYGPYGYPTQYGGAYHQQQQGQAQDPYAQQHMYQQYNGIPSSGPNQGQQIRRAQTSPVQQSRKRSPSIQTKKVDSSALQQHPLKQSGGDQWKQEFYEQSLLLQNGSGAYGAIPRQQSYPRRPVSDDDDSDSDSDIEPKANKDKQSRPPPPPPPPPSPAPWSQTLPRSHRRALSSEHGVTKPRHRRSSSDTPLAPRRPPVGPTTRRAGSTDPLQMRKTYDLPGMRQRSLSASSLRRGSSMSSVMSEASFVSVKSNIRRSKFFVGETETGKVQLHFPFEYVRLTTDKSMKEGSLYQVPVHDDVYEDYHLAAEQIEQGTWDGACHCTCGNCVGCLGKEELLPPPVYALRVDNDLYRRVLDEICESRRMPFKLYFCGHHEDVSHPSVMIAAALVATLFVSMGTVAYVLRA